MSKLWSKITKLKATGTPTKPKLFGIPLDKLVESTSDILPRILIDVGRYLESVITADGLFAETPSSSKVNQLKKAYNEGRLEVLSSYKGPKDAHTVAGILRQFLTDLPEPIVPASLAPALQTALTCKSGNIDAEATVRVIEQLPSVHRNAFAFLMRLFVRFVFREYADQMLASDSTEPVSMNGDSDTVSKRAQLLAAFFGDSLGISKDHLVAMVTNYSPLRRALTPTAVDELSATASPGKDSRKKRSKTALNAAALTNSRLLVQSAASVAKALSECSKKPSKPATSGAPATSASTTTAAGGSPNAPRPGSPAQSGARRGSVARKASNGTASPPSVTKPLEGASTVPSDAPKPLEPAVDTASVPVASEPANPGTPAVSAHTAPPTNEERGKPIRGKALYDFTARSETELSFVRGDILRIVDTDPSGWWRGETVGGDEGYFPANYIEVTEYLPVRKIKVKAPTNPKIAALQAACGFATDRDVDTNAAAAASTPTVPRMRAFSLPALDFSSLNLPMPAHAAVSPRTAVVIAESGRQSPVSSPRLLHTTLQRPRSPRKHVPSTIEGRRIQRRGSALATDITTHSTSHSANTTDSTAVSLDSDSENDTDSDVDKDDTNGPETTPRPQPAVTADTTAAGQPITSSSLAVKPAMVSTATSPGVVIDNSSEPVGVPATPRSVRSNSLPAVIGGEVAQEIIALREALVEERMRRENLEGELKRQQKRAAEAEESWERRFEVSEREKQEIERVQMAARKFLEDERERLREEIKRLRVSEEEHRKKEREFMERGQEEVEELRRENEKLRDQLADARSDATAERERRDTAEKALERLREERMRERDEARREIERIKAGLGDAAAHNEAKARELADQLDKLRIQHQRTVATLDARESEIRDLLREKTAMAFQMEKLQRDAERGINTAKKLEEKKEKLRELKSQIASLTRTNEELATSYKTEQRLRKKYFNLVEEMKGKIRVYCRLRPLLSLECEKGSVECVQVADEYTVVIDAAAAIASGATTALKGNKSFVFDKVFGPKATQEEVFADVDDLVQSTLDGYNVCIFAYGQTGSGKTYTITGTDQAPGVAVRAMHQLFELAERDRDRLTYTFKCTMLEIYLDKLFDLFDDTSSLQGLNDVDAAPLNIKKDVKGVVHVDNAVVREAETAKQMLSHFYDGLKRRQTHSTKMNVESSRSHLIFSIYVDGFDKVAQSASHGKLSLVDLAGSERVSKTGAEGERLEEAKFINKSLTALGDVIAALCENQSHIPYRNSKLTMLMSDSLGGNAKTLMFVNVSPSSGNIDETHSSLAYATRAKQITNNPLKNHENKEILRLKRIIAKLRRVGGAATATVSLEDSDELS